MPNSITNVFVNVNLTAILESKNESLHSSKFVNMRGEYLKDSNAIIAYLLKHDLIETEGDPDIYFLTTAGYEAQESYWDDNNLQPKERVPERDRNFIQDSYNEDEKPVAPIRIPIRMQGLIVTVLILLGSIWFDYWKNKKSNIEFPTKNIQFELDSLDGIKVVNIKEMQ